MTYDAAAEMQRMGQDVIDEVSAERDRALAELSALRLSHSKLLASLEEMGDWLSAGLQASREAWPDAKCLEWTEEIFGRARTAVDEAKALTQTVQASAGGDT